MNYCEVNPNIVESLKRIVGEKYVTTSKPILAAYISKSIMGLESTEADVIVRPKSPEEVRQILIVANENKIPVTPYSGGLSGGFSCPTIKPGGILIDLGRMNRIIEVDTDCRYVIVEPGVSSGEIWSYFRRNYPDWCPPIPDGAPPAATGRHRPTTAVPWAATPPRHESAPVAAPASTRTPRRSFRGVCHRPSPPRTPRGPDRARCSHAAGTRPVAAARSRSRLAAVRRQAGRRWTRPGGKDRAPRCHPGRRVAPSGWHGHRSVWRSA